VWAQNTVPGVILDVRWLTRACSTGFLWRTLAGCLTLRAFRNRQDFNLGPIRSYSVLCRTGLRCPAWLCSPAQSLCLKKAATQNFTQTLKQRTGRQANALLDVRIAPHANPKSNHVRTAGDWEFAWGMPGCSRGHLPAFLSSVLKSE
jgi:hypothetical protein